MQPFKQLVSRTVVLRERNIDTDQIIPARFLSTTERKGLGKHAFNDWRALPDGSPNPDFPFNRSENAGKNGAQNGNPNNANNQNQNKN